MNATFMSRLPGQFGRWAIHGFINALPSFFFAVVFLDIQRSDQIWAILSAIGCILLFSAITTSLPGPLSNKQHILFRALSLGLRLRMFIALLSMLLMPFVLHHIPWIIPDVWCGYIAVLIQNKLFGLIGWKGMEVWRGFKDWTNTGVFETVGFFPVFVTALLEGLIISFQLLMISFFCVIFLQSRERRRYITSAAAGLDMQAVPHEHPPERTHTPVV